MEKINVVVSNGQEFELDLEAAKLSVIIKDAIQQVSAEASRQPISIPEIRSEIFEVIKSWMEYHKNDPKLLKFDDDDDDSYQRTDDVSDWDKQLLGTEKHKLIELIIAANYLDIKGLVQTVGKTLANMIRGKSTDQICQEFDISRESF